MPQILGLNIDDYVKRQIDARQSKLLLLDKTNDFNKVFNTNTAWITLVSSVLVTEEKAKEISKYTGWPIEDIIGSNLAQNLVLGGGVLQNKEDTADRSITEYLPPLGGYGYGSKAYGFLGKNDDANFGYKPMPGITGITVSYKNNGTLKQAQVKLIAHTLPQFQAIETLYLRLGYTVLLQWGHSVYYDTLSDSIDQMHMELYSTLTHFFLAGDYNNNFFKLMQEIKLLKANKSSNYDGMYAKVCNYSWTLTSDLSYEITLDLISMGDIIDSLKFNARGLYPIIKSNTSNSETESLSGLENIFLNRGNSLFNSFLYDLRLEILSKDILKAIEKNNDEAEGVVEKIEEQNRTEQEENKRNSNLQIILNTVSLIENDPNIKKIVDEATKNTSDAKLQNQVTSWSNLITALKNPSNYTDKFYVSRAGGASGKQILLTRDDITENDAKQILTNQIDSLGNFENRFGVFDTKFQNDLETELTRILGDANL